VSRDIEIRAAKEWGGGVSPYPSAPSGIFDEFGSSQAITMSHNTTSREISVFSVRRAQLGVLCFSDKFDFLILK
jgi:hypothetical protein